MAFSIGRGTKVSVGRKVGAATTFTFTQLNGVTSIELPEVAADEVEVTHFNSPANYREYISGLVDAGEVTFEINYDHESATDTVLTEIYESKESIQLKFEIINGETQIWNAGFLKAYNLVVSDGEVIQKNPTFRINSLAE
ncbi:phage tail tube protein [Ketogulonicigenium vulgare]|uniref:phage tail tube protein n=1 Tax=Ketogulonicigenium vulgare TaxID=92945 RepID=UPI002359C127|nr:phage tail tube protein [Ketogulonicigenium vulgare]